MVLRALCFFLVLLPFTIATSCNEDNCLRALRNRAPTASPYCSTYTTTSNTAVPTWASSQCASNPTRVSSACSCLNTPTPTPTPGALRKVYGPKNDTKYTVYGEHINIRSDPYYEGQTYQEFFNNCYNMCTWYGSQCQTFSFGIIAEIHMFLCYIYPGLFNASKIQSSPGAIDNVVYQRAQL